MFMQNDQLDTYHDSLQTEFARFKVWNHGFDGLWDDSGLCEEPAGRRIGFFDLSSRVYHQYPVYRRWLSSDEGIWTRYSLTSES